MPRGLSGRSTTAGCRKVHTSEGAGSHQACVARMLWPQFRCVPHGATAHTEGFTAYGMWLPCGCYVVHSDEQCTLERPATTAAFDASHGLGNLSYEMIFLLAPNEGENLCVHPKVLR